MRKSFFIGMLIVLTGCGQASKDQDVQVSTGPKQEVSVGVQEEVAEEALELSIPKIDQATPEIVMPMDRAIERITKKPFGVLIDPATSPVQPERFSGYHVGTDFEVFDDELSQDISIYAICTGKILNATRVNGYGGVVTQACVIDGQDVRIVYGHVAIDGLDIVNRVVNVGERITKLGNHESRETDEERKHLHLGIIKGAEINLRGYVQNENELTKWLNIEDLIKS